MEELLELRVTMWTVIAITDEPLIEAGLRTLLSDSEEFEFLGACRSSVELRRVSLLSNPHVLLCAAAGEYHVPISDLRAACPWSAVVILGREFSAEYAHQALGMGIRGLVSSTVDGETLKDCLRKTARGELWMDAALSMLLLDTRPIRLSKRQSELINLLAQGLKNKEIAEILGISEGTVKAYLTALFEKVGAKDRFELALFGLKHLKHLQGEHVLDRPMTRPVRAVVGGGSPKVSVA